ncbi:Hypothetical predicted protein [Octopus vulgaris]|uniref:Uncharacterized protein n=1 Tax=Octopus vulgaris TaxID=6645 RepID=A0AA36FFN5_OCTVU|nr:Hypothetical predicted protein [Octopus vulgaris]
MGVDTVICINIDIDKIFKCSKPYTVPTCWSLVFSYPIQNIKAIIFTDSELLLLKYSENVSELLSRQNVVDIPYSILVQLFTLYFRFGASFMSFVIIIIFRMYSIYESQPFLGVCFFHCDNMVILFDFYQRRIIRKDCGRNSQLNVTPYLISASLDVKFRYHWNQLSLSLK